jgi:perosamine synthetase
MTEGLALLGGPPAADFAAFPHDRTTVSPAAARAVQRCLESGAWSMFTSPEVDAFERELGAALGARHVVLANSCTTAIHATLLAAGLRPGEFVGVPAFTYVGTCQPAVAAGARLVLIDVDSTTQSLSPAAVRQALDRWPLRALIQAHLFGRETAAAEISRLCDRRGVSYVSDCAQLIGDRAVTSDLCRRGPCCFSFGESKILRVGEGGAVATNSAEMAERLRLVRHEGEVWLRRSRSRLEGVLPRVEDVLGGLASAEVGLNYRPPALLAALGRVKLAELDDALARTRANAEALSAALAGLPGLTLPGPRSVWWTYPVLVDHPAGRDAVLAALLAEGCPAGVHFPRLMADHPAVREAALNGDAAFPGAARFAEHHLVLPIFPALGSAQMEALAGACGKVFRDLSAPSEVRSAAARFLRDRKVAELSSGLFLYLADSG